MCSAKGHISKDCPEPPNPANRTCRNCEKSKSLSFSMLQESNCFQLATSLVNAQSPRIGSGFNAATAKNVRFFSQLRLRLLSTNHFFLKTVILFVIVPRQPTNLMLSSSLQETVVMQTGLVQLLDTLLLSTGGKSLAICIGLVRALNTVPLSTSGKTLRIPQFQELGVRLPRIQQRQRPIGSVLDWSLDQTSSICCICIMS
jgi:hypothetical protein